MNNHLVRFLILIYKEGIKMHADFVKERISQLRLMKGVSEYQMSYDLGHSRGYINNISSGKVLPSMNEFFAICDYFDVTPSEFFDSENQCPTVAKQLLTEIKKLSVSNMELLLQLVKQLNR